MHQIIAYFKNGNLIVQIIIGMVLGIAVALISKDIGLSVGILGDFFVKALKAIAPILIFVLVIVAIATKPINVQSNIRPIMIMYIVGMFLASLAAVVASFIFPIDLPLNINGEDISGSPAQISHVLKDVAFKMVDNPVHALASANFIGVLIWGIGIGVALHVSSANTTKEMLKDVNDATLKLVRFIIRLAPFGIFGIMAHTVADTGISSLLQYVKLLCVLVGTMLFVALVINPIIMFVKSKRNPYPVVFACLIRSGTFAFFTRSSAANTPVNLELCEKMGLDKDTYSISIPLGTAINMSGAAVTITVFTLATAHTLGITVDIGSALLLCVISALASCGVSGVAGGSLLLIPLACSLFGISDEIAAKVIAIGFLIGVIQDSVETALNSSTDVMFTAAASPTPPNLDFKD